MKHIAATSRTRLAIAIAVVTVALAAGSLLGIRVAAAHCDGMDGPVVKAAQQALQTGDINRVLIWVRSKDADEIKKAFEETLAVRKLNPQAQALADRYFFEKLVRLHRAGENAPYTGLKPAGRDLGPAIPAADKALKMDSDVALIELLTAKIQEGLRAHFNEVIETKNFASADVAAGRKYVAAYVAYIHYVERLYEAAERQVSGHYAESQ